MTERILLGKAESGNSGLWVSKETVNVMSYASNGYLAGTEPGPEGLDSDGKVIPIYGYNENFNWTGDETFTYGYQSAQKVSDGHYITANGTLRRSANIGTSTPAAFLIKTMNVSSGLFTLGGHVDTPNPQVLVPYLSLGTDETFIGNNYPLLEIRLRRPARSDGTHWTTSDIADQTWNMRWYWRGINATPDGTSTNFYSNQWAVDDREYLESQYPWSGHYIFRPNRGWSELLGQEGEWATIEYDLENEIVTANTGGMMKVFNMLAQNTATWIANCTIDGLRFDVSSNVAAGHPFEDEPDLEIDYIRAKKRGIPMNFGNSLDENLAFSSDWLHTGLVHQTGTVVVGTEYAWANGTSKSSGTSHPGSQSGSVSFPRLPYVPVVLFQRYDDSDSSIKKAFPGGDKEFSFAHCEMSSNSQVWNPLTYSWQASSNTNYASEYRTFAYTRASTDHFDLTCRNAIARDGYEWLFNYAPQEPYVEIYKGGNYDPYSESPESFVMFPKPSRSTENELSFQGAGSTVMTRKGQVTSGMGGTEVNYNDLSSHVTEATLGDGPYSDYRIIHSDIVDSASPDWTGAETVVDTYDNFYGDSLKDGHAVGLMKPGVLGVRRGMIITTDVTDGGPSVSLDSLHPDVDQEYTRSTIPSSDWGMGWDIEHYHGALQPPSRIESHDIGGTGTGEGPRPGAGVIDVDGNVVAPNSAIQINMEWNDGKETSWGERFRLGAKGIGGGFGDSLGTHADPPKPKDNQETGAGTFAGRVAPHFHRSEPQSMSGGGSPYPTGHSTGITDGMFRHTGIGDNLGTANIGGPDLLLDWSARDYEDGKLGYFAGYTGTDAGNCLPTFDWANKMGDWNVPQFNNFYKYENEDAATYVNFKDAIGTSWTEDNTKFLDDSMWLGWANNRNEYKGDIWHPQAPTKSYQELSGVFGYGGDNAQEGSWAHWAGMSGDLLSQEPDSTEIPNLLIDELLNYHGGGNLRDYNTYQNLGGTIGAEGIHIPSRYDSGNWRTTALSNSMVFFGDENFHLRNRFMYRPISGCGPVVVREHPNHGQHASVRDPMQDGSIMHWQQDDWDYDQTNLAKSVHYPPPPIGNTNVWAEWGGEWEELQPGVAFLNFHWLYYHNLLAASGLPRNHASGPDTVVQKGYEHGGDYLLPFGSSGPGTNFTYDAPHNYGRMGAMAEPFPGQIFADPKVWSHPIAFWDNKGLQPSYELDAGWYNEPSQQGEQIPKFLSGINEYSYWSATNDMYELAWSQTRSWSDIEPGFPATDVGVGWERTTGSMAANFSALTGKGQPYWTLGIKSPHIADRFDFEDSGSTFAPYINAGISLEGGVQKNPSWSEPQTGFFGHKDSYVASRWYTYPGATFSYDISNFSGPAHYNAWHKNDATDEVQDYKRKDYPQLYEGGWGNYGYFPTQEQLDAGRGATRLFPSGAGTNPQISQALLDDGSQGFWEYDKGDIWNIGRDGCVTGGHPAHIGSDIPPDNISIWNEEIPDDRHSMPTVATAEGAIGYGPNDENNQVQWGVNHRHKDKAFSSITGNRVAPDRQFGIPSPIFGNYIPSSTQHDDYGHSSEMVNHYHPEYNSDLSNDDVYPDYRLNAYLLSRGIDVTTIPPGNPIPIQEDPYFAGMAFEGLNPLTGAFQAHRFEFIIKKTKSHINHFRQSYEYNLPGLSPHRADTLRPIGYGLMTNWYGFDAWESPSPRAHSYFDMRQLSGGHAGMSGWVGATADPFGVRRSEGWSAWGKRYDTANFGDDVGRATVNIDTPIATVGFGGGNLNYLSLKNSGGEANNRFTRTSIARHGRDVMLNGVIGAVEVANTASADFGPGKTHADHSDPKDYWVTGRPLKYRPAKSIGASPETQMYGNYLGSPWNRKSDNHVAWDWDNAPLHGSMKYTSVANYWETDVLPGMCKADNALTNWGTVDLSQFNEDSHGYKWYDDAWHDHTNGPDQIANSIMWAPSATTLRAHQKGKDGDYYESASLNGEPGKYPMFGEGSVPGGTSAPGEYLQGNLSDANWGITQSPRGGTYDGFKLHERPEFQPVSGDGRYFGGVGGVDNWGGTSYNRWGPGMSVSPTVWDLKWGSISHPFGMVPTENEDANTFYGSTSIENQTSYIGGAPNKRTLINDPSDYQSGILGSTPLNYDWCIGSPHIECNYWDRTLKIENLAAHANTGNTEYHFQYTYNPDKINPPKYKYWVLRIPASLPGHLGEPLPNG